MSSFPTSAERCLEVIERGIREEKDILVELKNRAPPADMDELAELTEMLAAFEHYPETCLEAARLWAPRDLRVYRGFKQYAFLAQASVDTLRHLLARATA